MSFVASPEHGGQFELPSFSEAFRIYVKSVLAHELPYPDVVENDLRQFTRQYIPPDSDKWIEGEERNLHLVRTADRKEAGYFLSSHQNLAEWTLNNLLPSGKEGLVNDAIKDLYYTLPFASMLYSHEEFAEECECLLDTEVEELITALLLKYAAVGKQKKNAEQYKESAFIAIEKYRSDASMVLSAFNRKLIVLSGEADRYYKEYQVRFLSEIIPFFSTSGVDAEYYKIFSLPLKNTIDEQVEEALKRKPNEDRQNIQFELEKRNMYKPNNEFKVSDEKGVSELTRMIVSDKNFTFLLRYYLSKRVQISLEEKMEAINEVVRYIAESKGALYYAVAERLNTQVQNHAFELLLEKTKKEQVTLVREGFFDEENIEEAQERFNIRAMLNQLMSDGYDPYIKLVFRYNEETGGISIVNAKELPSGPDQLIPAFQRIELKMSDDGNEILYNASYTNKIEYEEKHWKPLKKHVPVFGFFTGICVVSPTDTESWWRYEDEAGVITEKLLQQTNLEDFFALLNKGPLSGLKTQITEVQSKGNQGKRVLLDVWHQYKVNPPPATGYLHTPIYTETLIIPDGGLGPGFDAPSDVSAL